MKNLALFLIVLLFNQNLWSLELRKVFTMGMDFGGDNLVNVTYSDGSKSDIAAGQGIVFGGGAIYDFHSDKLSTSSLQTTLNWKFATIQQATNADVTWSRIPIEILGVHHFKNINTRVSAGASYQMSNSLKGTGLASQVTQDFETSLGYILQAEYMWDSVMGVGFRYTPMTIENATGGKINADSFGVNFSFYWGGESNWNPSQKKPLPKKRSPIKRKAKKTPKKL